MYARRVAEIPERLLERLATTSLALDYYELSALRCLAHGLTPRMAAEALGVTPDTVRSHLVTARIKLSAKNSTHAVAAAIRAGLIE